MLREEDDRELLRYFKTSTGNCQKKGKKAEER